MSRRTAAPRGGFTLIELLVVIAILAILVSLIVPAAMRVKVGANNAAEKVTINQIASAIGSYKAKMQVKFIPAVFVADDDYTDAGSDVASAKYLKDIFPQIDLTNTGLATAYGGSKARPVLLDNNQSLALFLTGGLATKYQGFATNRRDPFNATSPVAAGDQRIGPFYEVTTKTTNGSGQLLDRWGTPYAYFAHNPTQGLNTYTGATFSVTTDAGASSVSVFLSQAAPVKYIEPTGFQIVSAGSDTQFGPGGLLVPKSGVYVEEQIGGDDLANFAAGTLQSN